MSAITGLVHFNDNPISIEHSNILMSGFKRFPADSVDTWHKEKAFLGCHAQWITPESINEQLPCFDYEKQLAITADAIIDNRQEVIEKLNIKDKSLLNTMSDSQLILLAYSKFGEECPKHLIGDLAFAIWDEKNKKIFAARDFSGSRTLYYHASGDKFVFSTLIEPLLSLPFITRNINEDWLAEFLAIPGPVEAVDMNATPYKEILQLPPSHSITVSKSNVSLKRYVTAGSAGKLFLSSDSDYEEGFREVFQRAVNDRMRTHGKVGSHLSGGLDSGTVVGFAASELKLQNKQLHTYSYIPEDDFEDFTEAYYLPDERPFIKETVKHTGNVKDKYLNFCGKDPYTEVDDFLQVMEMPYKFFENTYWLKGINEEAEKDGIKVMLNGARGNHSISWGSYKLTYNYYISLLRRLRWLKLYQEVDAYCTFHNTGKKVVLPFLAKKAFMSAANKGSDNPYTVFIKPGLAKKTKVFEKLEHYGMDYKGEAVNDPDHYRRQYYQSLYPWNKSGTADTKLSLRYGLWNRDPTNDIRVIQYCLSIPEEQYVKAGMERSLIRRATKGILPDSVRLNRKYRGMQGADTIHRMKRRWGEFIDELKSLQSDSMAADILDMNVIDSAIEKFDNPPKNEYIFDYNFKILTRSLIVYKFLKGGEKR
ncbi:asparagine synthase-related protein [Evansella sp. LMS18]|uniref:asparagine synthase-related protein n=1 Tax=Evansella sp. LMS18 TaxID=2924033 RepID=UPI0020D135CC|nr:asparagine synthase-related protein [Evansella sp. LMS18]UTR10555.1 asparagine synthase-related protein [Evansella sp. LMS18]